MLGVRCISASQNPVPKTGRQSLYPVAFFPRKFIPVEIKLFKVRSRGVNCRGIGKALKTFSRRGERNHCNHLGPQQPEVRKLHYNESTDKEARWSVILSMIDSEIVHRAGLTPPFPAVGGTLRCPKAVWILSTQYVSFIHRRQWHLPRAAFPSWKARIGQYRRASRLQSGY